MSTDQIDGTALVTQYFEDRITTAETAVAEARAALAAAEAEAARRRTEHDTFTQDGTLHPAAYAFETGQPEWEVCQWAQHRVGKVAFTDMSAAGDTVYERRRAEELTVHAWLEENGYGVPSAFGRTS
ncbi:hypothetical protein [Streptomyces hydrogenans]|uniref:hypothetical protein n=1 Tax=Streptomyces hydrogenans TaxID=1873719 RepID=UPI0036F12BA5